MVNKHSVKKRPLKYWYISGNYKHFRSFVRRRRWIRLRHRPLNNQQPQQSQEPLLLDLSESTPSFSSPSADVPYSDKDITQKLQKCRLDRERLAVLNGAIKSTLPGLEDQLLEKVSFWSTHGLELNIDTALLCELGHRLHGHVWLRRLEI